MTNTWHHLTAVPVAQPAGALERSANFYPEAYTSDDDQPTLFCYYNRLVANLGNVRVNDCSLFYRKSKREWLRLTARLTTTVESKYWNLEKIAAGIVVGKSTVQLPLRLVSTLTSFIQDCTTIKQDMQMSVLLGRDYESVSSKAAFNHNVKFTHPTFDAASYVQQLTHQIRRWDVPRYKERQLDRRLANVVRSSELFFTYLESHWVLERRFGSEKAQIDSTFHYLKVLHHVGGAPGVVGFLGVVVNQDTDHVKGFLMELPVQGRLYPVLLGPRISMERRLKWCRQLVQGVASIHSKDLVIGTMGNLPDCGAAIDWAGNLTLYRFTLHSRCNALGSLPPELHYCSTAAFDASPETDLYQMGGLLWHIAASQSLASPQVFCPMAGHSSDCDVIHQYIIPSSYHEERLPQYLIDVIAACRADDPSARTPARQLLQKFPQEYSCDSSRDTQARPQDQQRRGLQRLEDCRAIMGNSTSCDHCYNLTGFHVFRCNICNSADFDICPACVSEGRHCLDDTHYLKEIYAGMKEEKYYTNVKAHGKRDVMID